MKKIGFVILFILIIDIYFVYNHVVNVQDSSYKELKIDSSLVQDLYAKVNPSEDATFLKGLYENDKFSNSYKIGTAIVNYVKDNSLQSPEYILAKDVENSLHSIFGYESSFTHEDTFIFSGGICGYNYDEVLNRYENKGGCGGNSYESFYRKIVSAEQTGDWILITEKSIYMYDDWDTTTSKKFVYNNYQKEKVLDYIETSSLEQTNLSIDNYLNDASTYVYQFRLKNGEYIFEGLKKNN